MSRAGEDDHGPILGASSHPSDVENPLGARDDDADVASPELIDIQPPPSAARVRCLWFSTKRSHVLTGAAIFTVTVAVGLVIAFLLHSSRDHRVVVPEVGCGARWMRVMCADTAFVLT